VIDKLVKKYIKGQNTFQREDVPVIKNKPSSQKIPDPVERQTPTESLNERRAIRGNAERLAYAKRQRKRMGQ
jgi:hypothetical protein